MGEASAWVQAGECQPWPVCKWLLCHHLLITFPEGGIGLVPAVLSAPQEDPNMHKKGNFFL